MACPTCPSGISVVCRQALTALQGVGPVTASALLCRAFPQHVAYMSDEALQRQLNESVARYGAL